MRKIALITGITGQDGSYLAKLMIDKGYLVYGTTRDIITANTSNLEKLGILNKIKLLTTCISDFRSLLLTLEKTNPDYIFHLAGQSSVGLSFSLPFESIDSILLSTLNLLECVKFFNKKIKIFIPCSSDCFGSSTKDNPSNENSMHMPQSPYAIAKSSCYWMAMNYKHAYGMFIAVGFLSNHESPLRGKHFVTSKIFDGLHKIKNKELNFLTFGNLDVFRDWGWAPSYVEAIYKMTIAEKPNNYIIATGYSYSLREIINKAFILSNLGDASNYIKENKNELRPNEIKSSYLDPSKAKHELNWRSTLTIEDLIIKLLKQELY